MSLLSLLLLMEAVMVCGRALTVLTSDISVFRGHSVSISQQQLSIAVDQASVCKVEVVLNEPLTQRVGQLTPQVFDCGFLQDEVRYEHHGSPLLEMDHVLLRVYSFSSSQTQMVTVTLTIRVLDSEDGPATLGPTQLEVPQFYARSKGIDSSVLTIRAPPGALCTVRLISTTAAPAAGRLVREDSRKRTGRDCPGNTACVDKVSEVDFLKSSCEDFLKSGLKYEHLQPPSPQTDFIPIRVELREGARSLLQAQALWLPVLILGALPNQPPRVSFMSSLVLEVDQFVLTPLSTAALDAEDAETPHQMLLFNVSVPPSDGFITHLNDHTTAVSSFTWTHLNNMEIAYQPPSTASTHRRDLQVEFQVIDGAQVSSSPIILHISIRGSDTNAPRVSWNTGLDLLEGQSRPITWEQLQVVDRDNLHSVYLVAVDGPLHGQLSVRGRRAFQFKVADLKEGVVVYHHSDSESSKDHIVFRISDGRHSIKHRFPIHVLPKDDSAPFLVTNVVIEVQEGGEVQLNQFLLASDLDSSDQHIRYTITSMPSAGRVINHTGAEIQSFLQKDLFHGLVFYQHKGDETLEDSFDFQLSDNHDPPNLSQQYTMVVQVFPVKDGVPLEVAGSVRSLQVKETDVAHITQTHLHFIDKEHPGSDLTFTITQPCFSPMHPGLRDAGRLFYTDNISERDHMTPALKTFSQHAVNHMKVAFMPPVEDIGPDPLWVQFFFSVTDQHGGNVSDLVFNITVTPVDNQAPQAFTNLLKVKEGGVSSITEEHLQVLDPDSREETLRVELHVVARHGQLELHGRAMKEGESFTLKELRGRGLRFIHDDSETSEDKLTLRVTDGLNAVDVVLHIQVLPMNDEPPRLREGLRAELSCQEGGHVQLTTDFLSATDSDSDDSRLSFLLARSPNRGHLEKAGLPVDRFTQQDIQQGLVYYVHSGTEVGPQPVSDSLTFIISDGDEGGACCHRDTPPVPLHSSLPVYDMNVTILPVNNQIPAVNVGEAVLQVEEGSSVCLSLSFLSASDHDSPAHQLTFHLQAPPLHGYLENTLPPSGSEHSSARVSVESFSLAHLTSGYINYIQSEHKGVEPTKDQLSIIVSDGLHSSAPSTLHILITPTNDELPLLQFANFTVEEGGVQELTPPLLDASDLDVPADLLTFSVQRAPAHGRLIGVLEWVEMSAEQLRTNSAITSFSLQELREGLRMLYVHDDTETLKDIVTVRLTDGVHTAERTVEVTVLPVNDQRPQVLNNVGVDVQWQQNKVISAVSLQSEDMDSSPQQLRYVLTAAPQQGMLSLKGDSGWMELSVGQSFSQEDVDMNRLSYRHTAAFEGFKGHDSFSFTLSDSQHEVKGQRFHIRVHPQLKGELRLLARPVHLSEGQRFVLSTDVLLADDSTNQPEQLLFSVLTAPRHGLLHATHKPGVAIHTFTQLDVIAQRVCYTHDNSHDSESDSFSFLLSNGGATLSGSLTFAIVLADRVPPTLLRNSALLLPPGAKASITSAHLQLSDPDSAPANITYLLVTPPHHGRLLLRGDVLAPPTVGFTQSDVDELRLSYVHTHRHTHTDSFRFLPSDGVNTGYLHTGSLRAEPAEFLIQVQQEDKTPPFLSIMQTSSSVVSLSSNRWGIFITDRNLRASDDSGQMVEFIITRKPHFGHLENVLTDSYIGGRFTQEDVDQRAIVFILPTDVNETDDDFQFRLSDASGNTGPPQMLTISWSRVQLSASCYRTCETETQLHIHLQRRGRSQDPAYVSIQVEEGAAKLGTDFTHSSSTLIQFDPGVNSKTWTVFPVSDGLEENMENFTLSLIKPQNTIVGVISSASVEILDATGGRCHRPRPPSPPPSDVIDVETELQWENKPHPRRGDVPDQQHLEGVEPEEQFHSLTPLHVETHTDVPQMDHPGNKEVLQQKVSGSCAEGWTRHRGRCFMVSSSLASWASAERTCTLLYSSSLPVIGSSRDVWWLWKFVGRRPFWTGSSSGSECVLVLNSHRWIPTDCSSEDQYAFLCSNSTWPQGGGGDAL